MLYLIMFIEQSLNNEGIGVYLQLVILLICIFMQIVCFLTSLQIKRPAFSLGHSIYRLIFNEELSSKERKGQKKKKEKRGCRKQRKGSGTGKMDRHVFFPFELESGSTVIQTPTRPIAFNWAGYAISVCMYVMMLVRYVAWNEKDK